MSQITNIKKSAILSHDIFYFVRDQYGDLSLFADVSPTKHDVKKGDIDPIFNEIAKEDCIRWYIDDSTFIAILDRTLFPEITYEDSPKEISQDELISMLYPTGDSITLATADASGETVASKIRNLLTPAASIIKLFEEFKSGALTAEQMQHILNVVDTDVANKSIGKILSMTDNITSPYIED